MQDEDWREWRLEAAGLTWRVALPSDAVAIVALQDNFAARFGAQDRPDLFASPVMLTLLAEDAAGLIVDGLYLEAVADITKFTTNRAGFSAFAELLPYIGGFLSARGIRLAQMAVVSRRATAMRPALEAMGFCQAEPDLSYWVRKVRD